ncbi:unnamed protein product [Parajaminaea phylloscopi]
MSRDNSRPPPERDDDVFSSLVAPPDRALPGQAIPSGLSGVASTNTTQALPSSSSSSIPPHSTVAAASTAPPSATTFPVAVSQGGNAASSIGLLNALGRLDTGEADFEMMDAGGSSGAYIGTSAGAATLPSLVNAASASRGHAAAGNPQAAKSDREPASAESEKAKKKKQDEERLAQIYEGLSFDGLWDKLSESLTRMEGDSSAAMILLPLIESLMVVSKHVATPEAALALEKEQAASSARGSVSPSIEQRPQPKTAREQTSENFFSFTEKHRKILNTMVRANPSLMSGSFSLLVHNPKVLDFDNKRNYFTQQLHKGRREHYTSLNLNVSRQSVFADSYRFFQRHSGQEIKHGKLAVRFWNEEGVDAGGVTREWFQVLARAMFNPDYALFAPCAADRTTYQPNRASAINPNHLAFFSFVGRVIGKAIYDGRLLDAYFTRSFYKHILGKPVDYRDLEAVDPEYFKSLEWMLHNDITDVLDLTFSVDTEEFGETQVIELKPNGQNVPVTEENKMEYVRLVTEQRLTLSIRKQIDAFLEGFHDIIPPSLIRIFSEKELELLISGLPDIDVDEWRNNTELHGYSQSDPVITWFWRAVRSFDQETRAKLLQFVTGTSKVPLEGFAHLQGVSGDQRMNIHKAPGQDRLPSAHTCFNQLDMPAYTSFEELKRNLVLAVTEAQEGFGFA